jgi:hypothetical protein
VCGTTEALHGAAAARSEGRFAPQALWRCRHGNSNRGCTASISWVDEDDGADRRKRHTSSRASGSVTARRCRRSHHPLSDALVIPVRSRAFLSPPADGHELQ